MGMFPAWNRTPLAANHLVTGEPMIWRYPRRYEIDLRLEF